MESPGPVLIAYDGSDNARAAIDSVAPILKGAPAVVVYARHPLEGSAAHLEGRPRFEDVAERDSDRLDDAERIAAEGADHARAAGLDAEARVASTGEVAADSIVELADQLDASVIVLGSRGQRGLKALLLGSVSHHVVHHARRPTLVVPSGPLAAARRRAAEPERLVSAGDRDTTSVAG